jgi:hypothetical protein
MRDDPYNNIKMLRTVAQSRLGQELRDLSICIPHNN